MYAVFYALYFAKFVFSEIRRCSPPSPLHLRHHLVQQRGVLLTLAADGGRGHVLVGGYAAVPQGVRQGRVRQDAQPRGVGGVKQEINVPAHKNVAPKQVLLLFQQGAVALWRESRLRSAEWSQHVGGEKQPRVILNILAREQRNHPHGLGGALQAQL